MKQEENQSMPCLMGIGDFREEGRQEGCGEDFYKRNSDESYL